MTWLLDNSKLLEPRVIQTPVFDAAIYKLPFVLAISLLSPSVFEISTSYHPQSDFLSRVFTPWGLVRCSSVTLTRRCPGLCFCLPSVQAHAQKCPRISPSPTTSLNPHPSLDLGSTPEPQPSLWLYHGTHWRQSSSGENMAQQWHYEKKTGQGGC